MARHRQARVLVVDDDQFHRERALDALQGDYRVECCADAGQAAASLEREPAELVISDLTMPGRSGLELLAEVRRLHPETDFILLTGDASIDSAVEALRMGAADYLRKPIQAEELNLVVARTLDRRRLISDNGQLRETLATVEACRALNACLEPAEVYSVALELAMGLLGRHRGLAVYYRANVPLAHGVELRGFGEAEAGALHRVIAHEKPVSLDSPEDVEVCADGPVADALRELDGPSGRVLVVPIRGEESEVGVLFLLEDGRPFESSEIERVRIVAGHAVVSLRNAERYHHAKARAFIDDVTEVYNARYLLEAMDREISRAERYGSELCVLFLDLDRFKLVNDRHGHLVGSHALRQLSRLLSDCVRQVDTLARYGGDEFTILLVDTPEDVGLRIAERIRSTVAETAFDADPGAAMHLTCSVGIAHYPSHGRNREQLLDAADKAMYRAKSNGRDRVCSASDLD